jgi:hypothetical protein
MLELPQVTICCVDGGNHALALRALARSSREIRFARQVFLTHALPSTVSSPPNVEVIDVGPIASHQAYSRIVMKDLHKYVHTSHALLVQWDGYVVNSAIWSDEFLDCDYLGALWPDGNGGYSVGNGGFSLRSRRLLTALQDASLPLIGDVEDVSICGHHRTRLESDWGIRFGTEASARRFAFELDYRDASAGVPTFGFHGAFNLFFVEGEDELVQMIEQFSDSVAKAEMVTLLLRNLVTFNRPASTLALGQRILAADPDNQEAAEAVVGARDRLRKRRNANFGGRQHLTTQFFRRLGSRRK